MFDFFRGRVDYAYAAEGVDSVRREFGGEFGPGEEAGGRGRLVLRKDDLRNLNQWRALARFLASRPDITRLRLQDLDMTVSEAETLGKDVLKQIRHITLYNNNLGLNEGTLDIICGLLLCCDMLQSVAVLRNSLTNQHLAPLFGLGALNRRLALSLCWNGIQGAAATQDEVLRGRGVPPSSSSSSSHSSSSTASSGAVGLLARVLAQSPTGFATVDLSFNLLSTRERADLCALGRRHGVDVRTTTTPTTTDPPRDPPDDPPADPSKPTNLDTQRASRGCSTVSSLSGDRGAEGRRHGTGSGIDAGGRSTLSATSSSSPDAPVSSPWRGAQLRPHVSPLEAARVLTLPSAFRGFYNL